MMYYFVAYENRHLIDPPGYVPKVNNVITPLHPLEWIKRTTPEYRGGYFTVIHFWTEIPDDIASGVEGVPVEMPTVND